MKGRSIADYLRFGFSVEFCPRCRWYRAFSPLDDSKAAAVLENKCLECNGWVDVIVAGGTRTSAIPAPFILAK